MDLTPAPDPTSTPTLTSEEQAPTPVPTPEERAPTPVPTPEERAPTPVPTPEEQAPTPVPTPEETAEAIPEPTVTAVPTPMPTADPAEIAAAAFSRFNEERQALGLAVLRAVAEGDDAFEAVQRFVVGCYASVGEYEELQGEDIDGISLSPSTEGTECGLRVVTYRASLADSEPSPEPTPSDTETPDEQEPVPTATEVPSPTPLPTPDPALAAEVAFTRINEQRQALGLDALRSAVKGDESFIPFEEFAVGCYASADEYAELTRDDIHGIALSLRAEGTECGLDVVTYHIVPLDERMRVESRIWECFSESMDIRQASDISCGGRFTFLGRHVRWLPGTVLYHIQEGEELREDFRAHIPWIREKLKVEVSEAESSETAHLILHLGVQSPANCPERYGCSVLEELDGRTFATIYISAPEQYFSQVLKHELLHALLPMGHLPQGNYLMSVRPDDPSQTHTLSPDEEKLLALYTHRYLRDGMTMEQFRRYLVIE